MPVIANKKRFIGPGKQKTPKTLLDHSGFSAFLLIGSYVSLPDKNLRIPAGNIVYRLACARDGTGTGLLPGRIATGWSGPAAAAS